VKQALETSLISNLCLSRTATQWWGYIRQGPQAILPRGSRPHTFFFSISHSVSPLNTTDNVRTT